VPPPVGKVAVSFAFVHPSVVCLSVRDVRNRLFYFCSVYVLFSKINSDSVLNQFGSVRFKITRFGSDSIVIYYSCNSKYYSDSE